MATKQLRQYGDPDDAIEALAIWNCNRQTKKFKDNGGASSYFHECLPHTQEMYREWAKDIMALIAKIKFNE